jgi:prepilin-type processing-associated H-X9-DG protein
MSDILGIASNAVAAYQRALSLGARPGPSTAGPMELNIPSIEGIGGSLIYLVDRFGDHDIYDVDFVPVAGADRRPSAGLTTIDPRGIWAMGFPGASVQNGGRGVYNPGPNNTLGGISADGGDELEAGSTYCNPAGAALGMGCTTSGTLMTSAMARSMHTGGVNVAMADGSGRFVSNNIDQLTYLRLSSTQDGQIPGDF